MYMYQFDQYILFFAILSQKCQLIYIHICTFGTRGNGIKIYFLGRLLRQIRTGTHCPLVLYSTA